jgi:Histidine kinase-, DNA gyrase B-, and HSP90-like ATPase
MADQSDAKDFRFEISLSVLNHLGRNLYRNFITVLSEAISNSWDADAKNVWITIDRDKRVFTIKDDGVGMTADDFQNKFLRVGYSKRKDGQRRSAKKRPYIGAKGIGKLALLSCAQRVSIFTKTASTGFVGGVIDNTGLDEAIKSDLASDQYSLEALNFGLVEGLTETHDKGTILVFEGTKDALRNSKDHIKKLLAMSFHFSLIDKEFTIHVEGEPVTVDDLQDISKATEFLWVVNSYHDDFLENLANLKAERLPQTTKINIVGYIASVARPRDLKISGTEERATIDLFVNGRLREKDIIQHIPTQRLVESYIYGQVHFDIMDDAADDPFTSSREGVIEDNKDFQALLDYLKRELLPRVFEDWDRLRLERDSEGDDENARLSKKARKARSLYAAAKEEYSPNADAEEKDEVEKWLKQLAPDAEFNVSAYVDCFLAENLIRKYIDFSGNPILETSAKESQVWKDRETDRMGEANISFQIRKKSDSTSYLGINYLAECAEGQKVQAKVPSLIKDAVFYTPVRNVVGHTGLLTDLGKRHLSTTYENIKARIKVLLTNVKP